MFAQCVHKAVEGETCVERSVWTLFRAFFGGDAAVPIEKKLVIRHLLGFEEFHGRLQGVTVLLRAVRLKAEQLEEVQLPGTDHEELEVLENHLQAIDAAPRQEAFSEACEVPEHGAGLPSVGVEFSVVEVRGGELSIDMGDEAPRAVVEGFAGDVHVVGVEHTVNEARGHPAGDGFGFGFGDTLEQSFDERAVFEVGKLWVEMACAVVGEK